MRFVFGSSRARWACGAFVLGCLLATQAAADLPSAVASRVKRISTACEAVEVALEADRLTTAQRKLDEANKYLDEIKSRYGGKFDETDPEYTAMLERLAATAAKVSAAETAAAGADEAAREVEAANEALCAEWIEKLAPFVDHKSDDCLRIGADFARSSPEQQASSMAAFPRAQALYAELQTVEFPLGKSMELRNVESSLAGALKIYERQAADAAQEEACRQWVDTLRPYVDVGMNSPKYLIASATADPEQIKEQQALFEEASAYFAHYKEAEFPLGKTERLQTLEERMEQTLAEFPGAMAESQAMISGDIALRLDGVLQYLQRDSAWVSDIRLKPPVVMERDLVGLREAVARYARTAGAGDQRLAELERKLRQIEQTSLEHAVIRAERTFQRPDGYGGADLERLKAEARAAAAKGHPGAEALRITIPSRDWVIEDVLEFTDTSRTALRRRITRSVRAEVAVRGADGRTWLQGIYIGQDQVPGGEGWGALMSHITWIDPMSAGNVGKAPPE